MNQVRSLITLINEAMDDFIFVYKSDDEIEVIKLQDDGDEIEVENFSSEEKLLFTYNSEDKIEMFGNEVEQFVCEEMKFECDSDYEVQNYGPEVITTTSKLSKRSEAQRQTDRQYQKLKRDRIREESLEAKNEARKKAREAKTLEKKLLKNKTKAISSEA